MTEDETVDELKKVFTEGLHIARTRGLPQIQLEMPAMDLLMDYTLILGADGIADVLTILTLETAPITHEQISFALGCHFEAERLCNSERWV